MKVCDRCKGRLNTDEPSVIIGEKIELCRECGKYILEHIRFYDPNKQSIMKRIFIF